MTELQRALLRWYRVHGRHRLPWRVRRDPYFTLVSELMLQQTQVERVVPIFNAFIAKYPTIDALANASVGDIVRDWSGLGYNSRAVRLHACARAICERYDGIPSDGDALRALPGIGPYTASAVRAFGFDLDDAPVDTNIRRIVHRLTFGIEYPARATQAQLDAAVRAILPVGHAHDWNSALMDLGATLCTARAPKCLLCPLQSWCAAAPIDPVALQRARELHATSPAPQNAIPFERTTRYARGRIVDRLRKLQPGEQISLLDLYADLQTLLGDRSLEEVAKIVAILDRDGIVTTADDTVALRA